MHEIYWFMSRLHGNIRVINMSDNYLKKCSKCNTRYYALWDRCPCGCKEIVTNNEEIKK